MSVTDDRSLTDKIYQELVVGLKTGDLDWTHFIAKHGTSKGPLYDAIGQFFRDMEPEAKALNDAQTRASEAELQLKSLNQKIEEADKVIKEKNRHIAWLEQKQGTLKKKGEALEGQVVKKGETLEGLRELEKLSFGKDRLHALHATISEMGNKRGLKPDEAADGFFAELKNYDAKIGFEQELQRLTAATEAARLEAQKWSTELRACEKKHKDLQGTINAMRSLTKKGVKPEQIVSWNGALTGVGGVEELEKCLHRYESVHNLLAAKQKEHQELEARIAEARAAVKTLTEQRAELEASIRAIRESAIEEIEKVSARSVEQISGVTQVGSDSIGQVGKTALAELSEALCLVDQVCAKALEVREIVNQTGGKLVKSRKIKEDTETLVARIEGAR